MAKHHVTPLDRLMAAMDRCAIARGEAQWTHGYRAKADAAESDRMYDKEQRQWQAVEDAEKKFRRLAQRLLRASSSESGR